MILASILITEPGPAPRAVPKAVARNIASLKAHHPDLPHTLFDTAMLRDLLRDEFGTEVLGAFDSLLPFAFKADLARYCLLHRFGGLYADVSMRFHAPWPVDPVRLGVFRDFPYGAPWGISNAIIAAPPGHKGLAHTIEMVLANVRAQKLGANPLSVTGPELFGRALAEACVPDDIACGDMIWKRVGLHRRPCAVHLGQRVAVNIKPFGMTLAGFGVAGANDYTEMWNGGRVFADTANAGDAPRPDP